MRHLIFAIYFSSLSLSPAFADNSFGTIMVNQYRMGRFCADVTIKDLREAGFRPDIDEKGKYLIKEGPARPPSSIFEQGVFNQAARNQILKNDCLKGQIKTLLENPELRKTWQSMLINAWVRAKKATLMADKCHREVEVRLEPADIKRYGVKGAYERSVKSQAFSSRPPLDPAWQDICFSQETVQALKAAPNLFLLSVPVVRDPEFFEIIEKNRGMLVSPKTGQPLKDEEILAFDFQTQDQNGVGSNCNKNGLAKISVTPAFEKSIADSIQALQDDRADITKKIKAGKKKAGDYELDPSTKNFIFEDGVLVGTMVEKRLIDPSFTKLMDSKKETVSNGAACILSRYDQTTKSTASQMTYHQIVKECPIVGSQNRVQKSESANKSPAEGALMAPNFLERVCSETLGLPKNFQEKIPACRVHTEGQSAILNSNFDPQCVMSLLMQKLPMTAALPSMGPAVGSDRPQSCPGGLCPPKRQDAVK